MSRHEDMTVKGLLSNCIFIWLQRRHREEAPGVKQRPEIARGKQEAEEESKKQERTLGEEDDTPTQEGETWSPAGGLLVVGPATGFS